MYAENAFIKGSSINDVTQFWTIFDPLPSIVKRLITVVLSSQNLWLLPPYDRDVIYGRHLGINVPLSFGKQI